jgi:hypothetical protein
MLTEKQREAATDPADSHELLWRFLAAVTRMINEHTNAGGRCACCGSGWPCDIAYRAESFLGGL